MKFACRLVTPACQHTRGCSGDRGDQYGDDDDGGGRCPPSWPHRLVNHTRACMGSQNSAHRRPCHSCPRTSYSWSTRPLARTSLTLRTYAPMHTRSERGPQLKAFTVNHLSTCNWWCVYVLMPLMQDGVPKFASIPPVESWRASGPWNIHHLQTQKYA